MAEHKRKRLLWAIFIGLILGAITGILFAFISPENVIRKYALLVAVPLGTLFINLLKMIVTPVIIFTLISGVASIEPSRLGKVGVKIIVFYMLTSLMAIVVGLVIGNIMQPGEGIVLAETAKEITAKKAPSLVETFLNIVPTNPFASIAKGDVLPIIFFSIFFGIALAFARDSKDTKVKESADVVYKFFDGCAQVIFRVVGWVMLYAPIGVFFLIFQVFTQQGAEAFGPLLHVTVSVYIGLALQIFVVYMLICAAFKINPALFLKKVYEPWLTAFVTRSSGGTLPVSMDTAERKMGISKGVYSFTLPLGATINMDGTTIYLGVCAIFIANAVGMPLDASQQMTVIITAVLASIGTAGVPGAGAIMLIMVMNSVGLDVTQGNVKLAYAMILGIDALLDMGRTSMNIVGDLCGTCVVAKLENEMDPSFWISEK
ncbi:MAG: dicarboxylate/amino acid:cation symporter [Mucispirillum sp.]|nr:dicarboxylate/amino acid:cation symporter [Mucispirillum sp.]